MSCRPRTSNAFAQFDVEATDTTPPRLPTQSVLSRIGAVVLILCCTSTVCLAVGVCASAVLEMSIIAVEAHDTYEAHEPRGKAGDTSASPASPAMPASPATRQRTRRRIRRGVLQRLALLRRSRPSEHGEPKRGVDVQSAAELFPHWFDDASVDPPRWNVDNVLSDFALALAYLSQSDDPLQQKPWTNDVTTLVTTDGSSLPPDAPEHE